MRFLIVYHRHRKAAEELLAGLPVRDNIRLLVCEKDEKEPHGESAEQLRKNPGSAVTTIQVIRKYCRAVEKNYSCKIELNINEFRPGDQRLREWLVPSLAHNEQVPLPPSQAFRIAARDQPRLLLAEGSLVSADELAPGRWAFANRAARALAEYAGDTTVRKPMKQWCAERDLQYAPNGKVSFKYRIIMNNQDRITEWHLKEGDHTFRENSARIYFHNHEMDGTRWVIVLYCGPHPSDGEHSADVHVPSK